MVSSLAALYSAWNVESGEEDLTDSGAQSQESQDPSVGKIPLAQLSLDALQLTVEEDVEEDMKKVEA